jgi:acyl phosphate:glycerol-3-phosphate acyltransferase
VSILGILWRAVLVIAVGYFLGGIPFGAIVARRLYHADITKLGSGNTGATNVFRSLGWRPAALVAFLDIAKGAVPALVALLVADPAWPASGSDLLIIGAGVAAMAGHMFSPYFNLRGGKGIATAAGAILVLMPKAFVALALIFVLGSVIIRIVSVASLLAAAAFPGLILWLYPDRPVLLFFAIAAIVLVVWSHRANIVRLVHGEEPRITMGRGHNGGEGSGS